MVKGSFDNGLETAQIIIFLLGIGTAGCAKLGEISTLDIVSFVSVKGLVPISVVFFSIYSLEIGLFLRFRYETYKQPFYRNKRHNI